MDRGAWRATVHGVASVGHHLATKLPTTTTDMFLNILFHYGVSQETGYSSLCYTVQFSSVAQSCLTLWDPVDCSPLGSSVHGILQARTIKWVAIPSSRGSSWLRDWTHVSCLLLWQVGSLPLALPGKLFVFLSVMDESSYYSTSSSAFGVVIVQDFDHSNRWIVMSHCFIMFFVQSLKMLKNVLSSRTVWKIMEWIWVMGCSLPMW